MILEKVLEDLINNIPKKDVSERPSKPSPRKRKNNPRTLHLVPKPKGSNLLELLHPGCFVKLDNQPYDLPPFQVINCKGGRCFVRQQAWGENIHWEVAHNRLKSA